MSEPEKQREPSAQELAAAYQDRKQWEIENGFWGETESAKRILLKELDERRKLVAKGDEEAVTFDSNREIGMRKFDKDAQGHAISWLERRENELAESKNRGSQEAAKELADLHVRYEKVQTGDRRMISELAMREIEHIEEERIASKLRDKR